MKSWCGLFATVTVGVLGASKLASKVGDACFDFATSGVETLIKLKVDLPPERFSMRFDKLPFVLNATVENIHFVVGEVIGESIKNSLENVIPSTASLACKAVVWFEAAQLLFYIAGIGSLAIYTYKKFNATTNVGSEISPPPSPVDSDDDLDDALETGFTRLRH